jgi:PKD repeat protein
MKAGSSGLPDPARITEFRPSAPDPVDLVIGPGGDLFYVDFGSGGAGAGTVRRISFPTSNSAPTAVASATPSSGPVPLSVSFSGTGSSDPDGDSLTYAWDLDGDGQYDDATGPTANRTYSTAATIVAGLRVTDPGGLSDTDSVTITVTSGGTGGTTLFSDGFESGDLSAWTLSTGMTVTTSAPYAGTYAGRATASSGVAYAYRTLTGQTDLTVSVRFKVLSQANTSIYLLRTASTTGKYGLGIYRTGSGLLALRNHRTSTTITSSTAISTGVWHELRLRQTVAGAASPVEVWLDGLQITAVSGTQDLGAEQLGRFQIGDNNNGRTFDFVYDEAVATTP